MSEKLGYKPKPIEPDFASKYPVTGKHHTHDVRAEGMQRYDADGKPYPTRLGIHGTKVAVDWEACEADGSCMDVCPVDVYEWALNPGKKGKGNDRKIDPVRDKELWEKYRTDKSDPVREDACIYCMACEVSCPTGAIKITPG